MQWNLIGRCANVEVLAFHNFRVFQDSIRVTYDVNKKDASGKKVTLKNLYANPLNPAVCCYTSLAVYLSVNRGRYGKCERIFQRTKGMENRVAAQGYCLQLKAILLRNVDVVKTFVRVDHANAYGLRKGGATYATNGTACPPDTSIVCERAKWSMSKLLDCYLHFAHAGDCYLGRVLACLDAMKPNFNVLPPHFSVVNSLERKEVLEAMECMYGPIMDRWAGEPSNDPTCLLLRLLASVIFHFDWLKKIASTRTDHEFHSIPLMFRPELVSSLKKIITIHPSVVIAKPTGIPPHVDHILKIQVLLGICNQILSKVNSQMTDIKAVSLFLNLYMYFNLCLTNLFNFVF